MLEHDPNGYDWPGYKLTSMSPEQWAENAIDHGWPMVKPPPYPADDEDKTVPDGE